MTSFEPHSRDEVLAALGADELRTTIEEKLYEIVEAAEARAHEIEDRALERALDIEQETQGKAAEIFRASAERAERMMVAIDSFEREVREALRSLRTRGAELAGELEAAQVHEAATEPEVAEAPPAPAVEAPDEEREEVRRRILDLFLAGRPRAEAERLLGRIDDGGRYIDLLDEIYEPRPERQQGSSRRRRGGRRRRRPGP